MMTVHGAAVPFPRSCTLSVLGLAYSAPKGGVDSADGHAGRLSTGTCGFFVEFGVTV